MEIKLSEKTIKILKLLNTCNIKAYIVGGALRDYILGKEPKDIDFASDKTVDEVTELLKDSDVKVVLTGEKYGTVTLIYENEKYELTTFRTEGEYEKSRRPKEVQFTRNLLDDLSRRDFTINAMAYSLDDGLIDPYNGIDDLKNKILRVPLRTGLNENDSAISSFTDDALRILRGLRFAGEHKLAINSACENAIESCKNLLANISVERKREELLKVLSIENPRDALRLYAKFNIWEYVIPEMTICVGFNQHNPHHNMDVFEHSISVVKLTPNIPVLRVSALLHDIAKPVIGYIDENGRGHYKHHEKVGAEMAEKILTNLKFPKAFISEVKFYVRWHMLHLRKIDMINIKEALSKLPEPADESLERLIAHQRADLKSSLAGEKEFTDFENITNLFRLILKSGVPLKLKDLAINGDDLKNLGIEDKKMSDILNNILKDIYLHPEYNTKEYILGNIKKYNQEI